MTQTANPRPNWQQVMQAYRRHDMKNTSTSDQPNREAAQKPKVAKVPHCGRYPSRLRVTMIAE